MQRGRESEVSEFLGGKSGVKSSLYPVKSLDFFNEGISKPTPKSILPRMELNGFSFSTSDEYLSTKELVQKHTISLSFNEGEISEPVKSFLELESRFSLRKYLVRNLASERFSKLMPVQMFGFPILLSKRECLVCAPTGSGKTLTFVVPILASLSKPSKSLKKKKNPGVRAVVVVPTRVLAEQIHREFERFGKGKPWVIRKIGKNFNKSLQRLKGKHTDIIVSTPQRLVSVLGHISLSNVEYLVMDEADRLFDMGFLSQIDSIVQACDNVNVVRCLFSATIPLGVEHLAKTFLRNPVTCTVGVKAGAASTIEQRLTYVGNEDGKLLAVRNLLTKGCKPPVLLFVNSKKRALFLYKKLIFDNYRIEYISADRNEMKVNEIIQNFRIGKIWMLICTDVMARGLDLRCISCVINYDFPRSEIEYIHRIGRTGRAGMKGTAITLFTKRDLGCQSLQSVLKVMKRSKQEIPQWLVTMLENPPTPTGTRKKKRKGGKKKKRKEREGLIKIKEKKAKKRKME